MSDKSGTHFVFVYGTLKRGYWNNVLLRDATFVSDAISVDMFTMADGGFPVVYNPEDTPLAEADNVRGELWEVTDEILDDLDSLEGHPHWYKREEKHFELFDGDESRTITAWIYLGNNIERPLSSFIQPKYDYYLEWPPESRKTEIEKETA